jgi:hypothetical protein
LVKEDIWRRTRALPIATKPEWAAQGSILVTLQNGRRFTSVIQLERIEKIYPTDWYVRKATWDAKRLLIDASWEPLEPATLKRIIEDRRQLLVRDEEELIEAVWAVLQKYQAAIRAEGSRMMRLWNEPAYIPKPEEPLSREIAAELKDALTARGVTATLEVKIREGQFVDIYISAVTADSKKRTVSMIIEVKGCWHEELKTALETQLAMRYLRDNGSPFGIYLVVWFLCDRWNEDDGRKRKTPHEGLTTIRAFLEEQASEVNADKKSAIRAFVLDATIEGERPNPAHPKRAKRVRSKRDR